MSGKIKWLLVLAAAMALFIILIPAFDLQAEEEGGTPLLASLWFRDNQETGELFEEPWEGKPEAPPFKEKPGKAEGPIVTPRVDKPPDSAAFEGESPGQRYGQGYWKRWLAANEDYTCPYEFTARELLDMLNTPARGDANNILLYQFIAAALNINVNGCEPDDDVQAVFDDALNHLEMFFEGEEPGASRDEILQWKDILEEWNEG